MFSDHREEGDGVETMRPDSRVFRYLRDQGIISQQRYDELHDFAMATKEREIPWYFPADNAQNEGNTTNEDSNKVHSEEAHVVRRRHRPRKPEGTADDEVLLPLLTRNPSPSSSATSSNVDWLNKSTSSLFPATKTPDCNRNEREHADADGSASRSDTEAPANRPSSSTEEGGSPPEQGTSSNSNDDDGTPPLPNVPPPPQPPPDPPHDVTKDGRPASTTKPERFLNFLSVRITSPVTTRISVRYMGVIYANCFVVS